MSIIGNLTFLQNYDFHTQSDVFIGEPDGFQIWSKNDLTVVQKYSNKVKKCFKSYYIVINPTWTKVQIETQIRKIVFSKRIRGIWVVFHEIPVVLQLLLSPGKKLENNSFTYFPYPYIYNTAQLIRLVHNFFARFFSG